VNQANQLTTYQALHPRICILVLGMHRSGTSAVTRAISLLGATLPKNLLQAGIDNKLGYWEPEKLVVAHDELLKELGSSWSDWQGLDLTRLSPSRLQFHRDRIQGILYDEFEGSYLFVLKEPRICRLIMSYKDILTAMSIDLRIVISIRDPGAVAASLQERNGIPKAVAQLLWLRHCLEAERCTRDLPRAFVRYEGLLTDPSSVLECVTAKIGLKPPHSVDSTIGQIEDFLKPDLQHHLPAPSTKQSDSHITEWVNSTDEALRNLVFWDNSVNRSKLDAIYEKLIQLETILKPAMRKITKTGDRELENDLVMVGAEHALLSTSPSHPGPHHESQIAMTTAAAMPVAETVGSTNTIIAAADDTVAMPSEGPIDIVIPVHNRVYWVVPCLQTLLDSAPKRLGRVILVDDRSDSNQSAKLDEIVSRFKNVELVRNNSATGGFAVACNLGAAQSKASLLLFLNTDCFVTKNAVDRLCQIFDGQTDVALACPLSNNSPELTFQMFPGRSYIDMANLISAATSDLNICETTLEACTIVGNCLAVRRSFFDKVGGFSLEWGVGYGEETDLQMLALSQGLKGVVDIGSYVYHFGGGTFGYSAESEYLRQKNFKLFMGKWRRQYRALVDRAGRQMPQVKLTNLLEKYLQRTPISTVDLDVLFYLPGLDQSVGGIHAVVAICNELIRSGLHASCALVGPSAANGVTKYKEPVLFRFLQYDSDKSFLEDQVIRPRIVLSTIFNSSSVVARFAEARGSVALQFVQGYEGYFESGTIFSDVIDSYAETTELITTSGWLAAAVRRHLRSGQKLVQLPLAVNRDIFFSHNGARSIDVCMVLRGAPDKGQWIILETLHRLVEQNCSVKVLCSERFLPALRHESFARVDIVKMPLDHYQIANALRDAKVFIDASHHEGYGLLPLEAALCGCRIVVSDSGGVGELASSLSTRVIPISADPQPFVDAALNLLKQWTPAPEPDVGSSADAGRAWKDYLLAKIAVAPALKPMATVVEYKVNSLEHMVAGPLISGRSSRTRRLAGVMYRKTLMRVLPRRLHLALRVLILGDAAG